MKRKENEQSGSDKAIGLRRGENSLKKGVAFFCWFIIGFFLLAGLLILGTNAYMIWSTNRYILNKNQVAAEAKKRGFDHIIILGAGVRPDGEPSRMLQERIDQGVEAYQILTNTPILMSGDSADIYYKETVVMAKAAENAGVPAKDILQDPYGISTYDSMWRLKELYQGKKVLIVTQGYHLSRSIFLARTFGMEAYGMDAQRVRFSGQIYRDLREVVARTKDFFLGFLYPDAEYTGLE